MLMTPQTPQEMLKEARDAAWTSRHAEAIALCTQALSSPDLDLETQIHLLDTRALSYTAQYDLNSAIDDAATMINIVGKTNPELRAFALIRKAHIQGYRGDLHEALQTATLAVQIESISPILYAEGLNCLGVAQWRIGDNDSSIKNAKKAIAIFEANNTPADPQLYSLLAHAYARLGDDNESRLAAQTALALSQQTGNQYNISHAHFALALSEKDSAKALTNLNQALEAAKMAGNILQEGFILNSLAILYKNLGLFSHAHRILNSVVELSRHRGSTYQLTYFLYNQIRIEIHHGELEAARTNLLELAKLVPALNEPNTDSFLVEIQGNLAFAEGKLKLAINRFLKAAAIAREAGLARELILLAFLGKAYLVDGDIEKSLETTTKAINLYSTQSDANLGGRRSKEIWWRHTQALIANRKVDEAQVSLEQAHNSMLEEIVNMRDAGLRRNYLNKVAVNREIIATWLNEAVNKKLSNEQRLAHLLIESDVREPFQRLVDSGLRLNELRTQEEIYTFLVEEATELSGGERVLLILESDDRREVAHALLPQGEDLQALLDKNKDVLNQVRRNRVVYLESAQAIEDPAGLNRIVAPLITQNNLLGYLYIDMATIYGTFDETDRDMIGMLANQAAVALDNAQWAAGLEKKVEERTAELNIRVNELAIINSVQSALAAELDMQEIYEAVGNKIREIFHGTDMAIRLYDAESSFLHFPYEYKHGQQLTLNPMPLKDFGFSAHVINNRETLVINDNMATAMETYGSKFTFMSDQMPEATPSKSAVIVPLISGNQARGLILISNPEREYAFSESDVRLLKTLANSMSIALENARLFAETQRNARETTALAEVGRDISATLELSTVLERIANHARDLLEASDSAVFLPDEHGTMMLASIALGPIAEQVKAYTIRPGIGILGDLWQRRESAAINDSAHDPRAVTIPGTETPSDERMLVAPLLSGEQVSGMMAVWRTGQPFNENDLHFLEGLARQAAIAIKNANLFEEALAARRAAEAANKAKSAFLANMSHELRTPLNAIIGFTRIVKRKGVDSLPAKQRENLEKVLASSDHLLGLINTLLDIAKIEAGRMDIQTQDFTLSPLAEQALLTIRPLVKPAVNLVSDIPPDLPTLHTDQNKVKQIIINLLSNAAKFTHEGQIILRARTDGNGLRIEIEDTGIGISPALLPTIFEEFQQVDSSSTRAYGGTGLGLSISRSLARLLGGDLTATSIEGKGSTFTLEIPIRYGQLPLADKLQLEPGVEPRTRNDQQHDRPIILVIDDDPDVHDLLKENLSEHGYQVIGTQNGDEGLRLARQLAPFSITLDIVMPHKDGWQVLYELKADPATRNIPVILVTIVDNRTLGYQLGAADYLIKPLEEDALLSALQRLTIQDQSASPVRLLVVDDDPHIADMVRQLLVDEPYHVYTVTDGREALQIIRGQPPDLILLDLLMPHMDGFTVIETMRREGLQIPVIILTAKTLSTVDRERLTDSVERIIQKNGLKQEHLLAALRNSLDKGIG